jgi:NADPH:quinone reductase-like Zn-dependent oxidoreductase
MKALLSHAYGPVDQLTVDELPTPLPGPGEVLVRVRAAALNPLDVKLVTGQVRLAIPARHPFVPGLDVAGEVVAVGTGVTAHAPGDEVVGFAPAMGTLAEYAVLAAGPRTVARPEGLDPARAAAVPVAALTASSVLSGARVRDGGSLLVVGATGGVGSFAVQLAARSGLRVLAPVQAADEEYARGLGVTDVLDRAGDPVAQAVALVPDGVDAVVDLVHSGPDLVAMARAIRPGGRLVSPVSAPGPLHSGVIPVYTNLVADEGLLARLVGEVAAGELSVAVTTYPFEAAPTAFADFVGQHTRGKIVVMV